MAAAVLCAASGAAVATFLETRQQALATQHINDAAAVVTQQIMPLSARIAAIRYDVAQVQQWLTDLSATRALDGLDDGEEKAAEYAADFDRQVAAAIPLAERLGLTEEVRSLNETRASFAPYYAAGREMAQAYVTGGPAAGNRLMAAFDAASERMTANMTRLIAITGDASAERVARLNAATAEIVRSSEALRVTLLVCGLFILAAIGGSVLFLVRSVTRPVGALTAVMQDLARGRHDVAIGFEGRRDEIGSMADAVRVFQRAAQDNAHLRVEQEQVRRQAEQERHQALVDMADKVEAETRKAVERVAQQTSDMSARAALMLTSAQDVTGISRDLADAADQALANAQAVAAATEQLSSSIQEIGSQARTAATVTSSAVQQSASARLSIEALSQAVERIGTVAQLIEEFASQTNLLALNATIEAARAGEAGRGFAVVASEVKNLASGTASSTSEIGSLLTQVRTATLEVVETVRGVSATIAQMSQISAAIAAAVEQQSATTGELARAGAETSDAAQHVSASASRAAAVAEASQAGANEVRVGASAMADGIFRLGEALVCVVRSSTSDVDRRAHPRFPVRLEAWIAADGDVQRAVIVDLSQGGAQLIEAPSLSAGSEGTLQIPGLAFRLPFVVRNHEHDRLHIAFRLSAEEADAFARDLPSLRSTHAPTSRAA